jgi:hypothetical protein
VTDHEERMAEARESYQSEREYKQRLERIATAVMAGAQSDPRCTWDEPGIKAVVKCAIDVARALIAELDKEPA